MKYRNHKQRLYARLLGKTNRGRTEEQAWLDIMPVGREFGSKDYELLGLLDIQTNNR
ncbi:hypothetical protein EV677_1714 [Herminiimonas fonticola]|uniref:Uncharacterized protein n=1 Tax=Herminiimonas fonticola TaxID=303380 RepID=A0A4R6G7C9_9BURK|nr:hypothetical protein Hfont_1464 [Herminiimonas fonticola]TDN89654.1 hypothetical protein EV677_1714 [Herminiimonas fonticola]